MPKYKNYVSRHELHKFKKNVIFPYFMVDFLTPLWSRIGNEISYYGYQMSIAKPLMWNGLQALVPAPDKKDATKCDRKVINNPENNSVSTLASAKKDAIE